MRRCECGATFEETLSYFEHAGRCASSMTDEKFAKMTRQLAMAEEALREEAENAIARIAESRARIAELQALVDAATSFRFMGPGGEHFAETGYPRDWCVFYVLSDGDPMHVATGISRDEAIALARELAAKEEK